MAFFDHSDFHVGGDIEIIDSRFGSTGEFDD
jgi:hypothetical protein